MNNMVRVQCCCCTDLEGRKKSVKRRRVTQSVTRYTPIQELCKRDIPTVAKTAKDSRYVLETKSFRL